MFIKAENLTKVYKAGGNEIRALDGVSFELEKGKIYTIVGPSGSGKTTLFNILGGIDVAQEGSAFVDGKEVTKMSSRTHPISPPKGRLCIPVLQPRKWPYCV